MFNRLWKSAVAVLAVASVGVVMNNTAEAQWRAKDFDPFNKNGGVRKSLRELDKTRLNAISPGFRAGRDYTKIYVKNDTRNKISIAVIDIPFVVVQGNVSTIDEPTRNKSPWRVHAWYNVGPGGRVHVSNTSNRNVYVYAQDAKGHKWTGTIKHYAPFGKTQRVVGFSKHSFKKTPEEFTIKFTP